MCHEWEDLGHENPEIARMSIYPNPANDWITIDTKDICEGILEIHSINGQLIHSLRLSGSSGSIDLSAFPKGVFIVSIRSRDFNSTGKIVKLR
jgi:hypothetical protein